MGSTYTNDLSGLHTWQTAIKKNKLAMHRQLIWVAQNRVHRTDTVQELINVFTKMSDEVAKVCLLSMDKDRLFSQSISTSGEQLSCIATKDYKKLLGSEFDLIIFDATHEINLNALYASLGTLCGGGLVVIVLPYNSKNRTFFNDVISHTKTDIETKYHRGTTAIKPTKLYFELDDKYSHSMKFSYEDNNSTSIFLAHFVEQLAEHKFSFVFDAETPKKDNKNVQTNTILYLNSGPFEYQVKALNTPPFETEYRSSNDHMGAMLNHKQIKSKSLLSRTENDLKEELTLIQQQLGFKLSDEQKNGLAKIWPCKPHSLDLIIGERGRGKSTLLSIYSALLMRRGTNVVVCASDKASLSVYFEHLKSLAYFSKEPTLSEKKHKIVDESETNLAGRTHNVIAHSLPLKGHLKFSPPDQIKVDDDTVIIVDEVASIAPSLLKIIAKHPNPIIFCGTSFGYEGSGQGFLNRVLPELSKQKDTQHILLNHALRWSDDDFLEYFMSKQLVRLAEQNYKFSYPIIAKSANNLASNFEFIELKPQELIAHTNLYEQVFSLLQDAHYQTTPNDLVRILDSSDHSLVVLTSKDSHSIAKDFHTTKPIILAVAVLISEGGESLTNLVDDICYGRRRVNGHLSPQSLGLYLQDPFFVKQRYLRVSRIAVNPELHRRKLGSTLLRYCEQLALQNNYDFISTSFGATDELHKFWLSNGFLTTKLGTKVDSSSGTASVLMIKPCLPLMLNRKPVRNINLTANAKTREHSAILEDIQKYVDAAAVSYDTKNNKIVIEKLANTQFKLFCELEYYLKYEERIRDIALVIQQNMASYLSFKTYFKDENKRLVSFLEDQVNNFILKHVQFNQSVSCIYIYLKLIEQEKELIDPLIKDAFAVLHKKGVHKLEKVQRVEFLREYLKSSLNINKSR